MKTALNQLFGVRCPKAIANPTATKVHHTFESSIPGGLGGTRVGDEEAFCGKYSVKNPWYLFRDDTTGQILGQSVRMVSRKDWYDGGIKVVHYSHSKKLCHSV